MTLLVLSIFSLFVGSTHAMIAGGHIDQALHAIWPESTIEQRSTVTASILREIERRADAPADVADHALAAVALMRGEAGPNDPSSAEDFVRHLVAGLRPSEVITASNVEVRNANAVMTASGTLVYTGGAFGVFFYHLPLFLTPATSYAAASHKLDVALFNLAVMGSSMVVAFVTSFYVHEMKASDQPTLALPGARWMARLLQSSHERDRLIKPMAEGLARDGEVQIKPELEAILDVARTRWPGAQLASACETILASSSDAIVP